MKQMEKCLKVAVEELRKRGADVYYILSEELTDEISIFWRNSTVLLEKSVQTVRRSFCSFELFKGVLIKKVMQLHYEGKKGIHILVGGCCFRDQIYYSSLAISALSE